MIDIDRFKGINDGYGHLAGDNALKEIAHRVEGQIRSMDTAARFGGDELAVLLPEATAAEAAKLAERIREVIAAEPFALTAHIERSLTVSVGVASVAPGRHETDLKAMADRSSGRCRCGALPGQGAGAKSRAGGCGIAARRVTIDCARGGEQ